MTTSRRLRPVGPSPRTKRAVLKAAIDLLGSRGGAASVTIEKIAARAKVAKTTVYRWWPSKISIFMDLYEQLKAKRLVGLADAGSVEADLRHLLRGLLRLFRTTPAGAAVAGMITEAQINPGSAEQFRQQFVARGRDLARQVLERAKFRRDLPRGVDIELATDIMSGAIWYRLLLGHAPLDDAYADEIVRTVLEGVRPRADAARHERRRLGARSRGS